MSPMSPSQS